MVWVNGVRVEADAAAGNRSFNYGDGCFTTMMTRFGQLVSWPYHDQRLKEATERLGISLSDWPAIERWARQAALADERAGIKVHISRGAGARGYGTQGSQDAVVTITTFAYPSHYADWQRDGLVLGVCEQAMGHSPMLAGIKHNNRLEQVLLKREMEASGYVDGIACDINGCVIETTMANLFWIKNNTLFTPKLTQCGVAGTMRRQVMELAQSLSLPLTVGEHTLDQLLQADGVFITNALLGVAPVSKIKQHSYPLHPLIKQLQEKLTGV
jgi:4-amino-4-deoxychorismate lyase